MSSSSSSSSSAAAAAPAAEDAKEKFKQWVAKHLSAPFAGEWTDVLWSKGVGEADTVLAVGERALAQESRADGVDAGTFLENKGFATGLAAAIVAHAKKHSGTPIFPPLSHRAPHHSRTPPLTTDAASAGTKRARAGAGSSKLPAAKRKYIRDLPGLELKTAEDQLLKYLQHPELRIFGDEMHPFHLIQRPCYEKMCRQMYAQYLGHEGRGAGVVITGPKGVGKTCFGLHLLRWLRCLPEPPTVVYRPSIEAGVHFVFDCAGITELTDEELAECMSDRKVIYIIDAAREDVPRTQMEAGANWFVVVVSSPARPRYSVLLDRGASIMYTPPWSWEEVERSLPFFPELNCEVVRHRFELFGGAARRLFEPPLKKNGAILPDEAQFEADAADLSKQVQLLAIKDVRDALYRNDADIQGLEAKKATALHTVVHIWPEEEDILKCTVRYASKAAFQELMARLVHDQLDAVADMLDLGLRLGISGTTPGHHFEFGAHIIMASDLHAASDQRRTHQARVLLVPAGGTHPAAEVHNLTLPKLAYHTFRRLDEVTQLELGEYYLPIGRNFETADSFALMPSNTFPFWDEGDQCLVVFQATTAASHSLKYTGLRAIEEKRPDDVTKTVVVFLVPVNLASPNEWRNAQNINWENSCVAENNRQRMRHSVAQVVMAV